MANATDHKQYSLSGSATTLAMTMLAMLHTRIHLLALDLEEDRLYLLKIIKYGLFAFFCLSMGITVLTVLLAVLFWDTHRVLVLAIITGLFLLLGLLSWGYAAQIAKNKPGLFNHSLSELVKDQQSLETNQ